MWRRSRHGARLTISIGLSIRLYHVPPSPSSSPSYPSASISRASSRSQPNLIADCVSDSTFAIRSLRAFFSAPHCGALPSVVFSWPPTTWLSAPSLATSRRQQLPSSSWQWVRSRLMQRSAFRFSTTPAALMVHRDTAAAGSGGGGGSGGNKGGKGSDKGSEDGEDPVPPIDDDTNYEEWLVPRTCLFVLIMILITLALWMMAQPTGRFTGWASLKRHAGEIRSIELYEHYAQVYLDNEKAHLGLVHDSHTQRKIDEIAEAYRLARVKEKSEEASKEMIKEAAVAQEVKEATAPASAALSKENSASTAAAGSTTASASPTATASQPVPPTPAPLSAAKSAEGQVREAAQRDSKVKSPAADRPEELQVVMRGSPLAEKALVAVGVFAWVVPFVFFPVFVMFLSQYIGKSMSAVMESGKGKSKVKDMIFKVEKTSGTRFRDIAGMKEPKKEITEIVDFLRHPERYTKLGAKIPTGALLLGPPGTGKTLLAKAVAGESGVGFIPVCGSDFVELYVGMGALRVRQLFKEAKKQRCIVFIDEIDAIGLKRQGAGHGEKQETEQTLNELLTQLDGFNTGQRGEVMVLASSNIGQEQLDPALIRPGRFDRIIHVDSPVIAERVDIFKVHLSKLKLVPEAETNADTAEGGDTASTAAKSVADEQSTVADADVAKSEEERAEQKKKAIIAEEAVAAAETEAETHNKEKEKEKEEEEKEEETTSKADSTADGGTPSSPASVAAAASPSTTAEAASTVTPNTTEKSVTLSSLESQKEADEALRAEEASEGRYSFDFRSLLLSKTEKERALIDVYAQRMSDLCPGFVGADIANVCNEGAILAAREGASYVHINHLERSIDRVLAGIEHRSRALSAFEKDVVAHHEAGHAVAGWFLNRADPLMKVSIVPRGGSALGYAQYLPNENYMRTAKEIRAAMSVSLGGRVAEQIFFHHLSTGASDDLRKVSRMAYEYVASFAPGSVYPSPGSDATRIVKPYGEKKSNEFDRKAQELVGVVYNETYALLQSHKDDMERLAQHLLKYEVLTYQDVVNYLGKREEPAMDRKKGV